MLQEEFLVPSTWIDGSKALRAKARGDVWQEHLHLLSAQLYSEAHRLLVLELAPEAILRSDMRLLTSLFEPLLSVQDQVADWQTGGQVRCWNCSHCSFVDKSHRSTWISLPSKLYRIFYATQLAMQQKSNASRKRSYLNCLRPCQLF